MPIWIKESVEICIFIADLVVEVEIKILDILEEIETINIVILAIVLKVIGVGIIEL